MSDHDPSDDDLAARMRAADPAASLPPAGPDRVERLLEDTMSDDTTAGSRRGRPLTWLVAAAAVVLVAGAGVFVLTERGGTPTTPPTAAEREPTVLELTAPADAGAQRCRVPDAQALGGAQVAFDGEVSGVADGRVTLVPTRFYTGGPADEVTVAQGAASMQDLVGAVGFEEGQRYLVAATGSQVMVCGFSGPYDAQLAELYAAAFDPPE